MKEAITMLALCTTLFTVRIPVWAQQPKNFPRIGLLVGGSAVSDGPRIEAFRQWLRDLGYIEGKNIAFDYRFADGKLSRLSDLAAALVHLKVDIIIAAGPSATRAARKATNVIPIVMAQVNDPVGDGFVVSLARPGGNITGLSSMATELSGKQLELLKEIIPGLSRLAVLGTSTQPGTVQALGETKVSAQALGVQMEFIDVRNRKDIEVAFPFSGKRHADALLLLSGPILTAERRLVVVLAANGRLPAMYFSREFVEDGGLVSYGTNLAELWRRAAVYVNKILKGAKPAELPVEQPTKFDLVINLQAAKQIGLTIPPSVLARADKVIK